VPHTQDENGQMGCQIDATEKKNCPQDKIGGDGQNAQREPVESDGPDRALYESNHTRQGQRGGAEDCSDITQDSHDHAESPATGASGNGAVDELGACKTI
jgi:hypothetical protein